MKSPFSPSFWQLLGRAVLLLAIIHLVFQLTIWLPLNWGRHDRQSDLVVYYDAAMRLKNGQSPYQPWPEFTPSQLPSRFFYPPPFLLLTRPLVDMPYVWFGRVWRLLMLLAFWVYAACLGRLATGKWHWKNALIAGLTLGLYPPTYVTLGFGNFEPVMWACYGLALTTRFRAVPLALATMMKLHPLWALLLLCKNEGRRATGSALLTLVLGFAAGIALCGAQFSALWWPSTSPVVSQGTFYDGNVSISFALLRIFTLFGWLSGYGPWPTWVKLYLSVCAVGAPIAAIFLTRKLAPEMRYALIACATILFAPLCWTLYIPLLYLPVAIWLGGRHNHGQLKAGL